jgi:ATP-binding cassette subfamily F protein 3
MELLEIEINEYNDLLCDPNVFQDHEKVMEVQTKLDTAQESLDQLLEEWTELEE